MKIITRTIYGSQLQTSKLMGIPHVFAPNTTLNEKFDIQSGVYPAADIPPDLKYIAIGCGVHQAITGADGIPYISPLNHRASDAALFRHIPFILREVNNDLSPSQRAKYALRKLETHNSRNYVAYYLKRLDLAGVRPEMQYSEVIDGVKTTIPYEPTSANLNPVPPALANTGVISTDGNYLSCTASIPIVLDANDALELMEVARIIYGNELYAVISEIGLCTGVDKTVDGPGAGGNTISYMEAIGVQVASHVTAYYSMSFSNQGITARIDLDATEPLIGESIIATSP